MEHPILNGKGWGRRGFTLIEMMIVMAITVILLAVAVPFYQKAIIRAKETVLHNNLRAIRNSIDEYSYDKQKAPQSLQDMVTAGYLHDVPEDPIMRTRDWNIVMEEAGDAVNASEPGIYDVHSRSDKTSPTDQTRYADW
jgi:general secretion pathway protein G